MNETILTMTGNMTADPELRFTQAGVAVANFTVAATPRSFNKTTNDWEDGDTLFMRCSAWRQLAENIAESCKKGARVTVSGNLKQRSYETKEGEKRTVIELDAMDVSLSIKHATATMTRNESKSGFKGQGSSDYAAPAAADPWASGAQQSEESPF